MKCEITLKMSSKNNKTNLKTQIIKFFIKDHICQKYLIDDSVLFFSLKIFAHPYVHDDLIKMLNLVSVCSANN